MTPALERSGFILICVIGVNAEATAGTFHAPWCTVKHLPSYWQLLWIVEWRESFNCTQIIEQETGMLVSGA